MTSYTVGKSRDIMAYTETQSEKEINEMNNIRIKRTKSQCYCELQQSIFTGSHIWSRDYII